MLSGRAKLLLSRLGPPRLNMSVRRIRRDAYIVDEKFRIGSVAKQPRSAGHVWRRVLRLNGPVRRLFVVAPPNLSLQHGFAVLVGGPQLQRVPDVRLQVERDLLLRPLVMG